MKTIAFVTSEEDPQLTRDDLLALHRLEKRGLRVKPLVWDTASHETLREFDALIFRSCWNAHIKFKEFNGFLGLLKKFNGPIYNSLETAIWNINKKYLLSLKQRGILIPNTHIISNEDYQLKRLLYELNSSEVVVKPAVSLNGYETHRLHVNKAEEIDKVIKRLLPQGEVVLQEFMPEILSSGEISLIFFNSKFSHAVRKVPKNGEFRIHEEHGGQHVPETPSPELISQAQVVLEAASFDTLSIRVDCVVRHGNLILMELEILDPSLFLSHDKHSPERFAEAILQRLK